MRMVIYFLGRLVVGAYYIYSGLHHFLSYSSMVQYTKFKGVPLAEVAVPLSGLLLLAAGVSLFLGYHPDLGVLALVVFLVPVSYAMHNFWAEAGQQRAADLVNFLKNAALLGSALMFMGIQRPWPLSLDKKKRGMR
jgi:putative oxidoreductase